MQLAINTTNIEIPAEVKSQIKQKAQKVFARVSDNINAIKLSIKDVNSPKGGNDKECTVVVHCHGLPQVVATNNQQSIISAVNSALTKAHKALVNKRKKLQANRPKVQQVAEADENTLIRDEYIRRTLI